NFQKNVFVKIENLDEGFERKMNQLFENQNESTKKVLCELQDIKNASDKQFSQTLKIKKTYDNILEEQKKRTIDVTGKDRVISKKRAEGMQCYKEKNFLLSHKLFSDVLLEENDDFEVRSLKAKSLYYLNRLDSSKYHEILNDIRIVKENGFYDSEIEKIENEINQDLFGSM
ncbi:MAG: hypothetical protein IKI31_00315, partial [Treponema sp.]|nr:hypothetical protein [Treponema sp.]